MDKWDKRFIKIAELVGGWSSCFQDNRHVGAVVKGTDAATDTTGQFGIVSCKEKALHEKAA